MAKSLERRHLPVPDPPGRKGANEFGHLVARLRRNDEHTGASAGQEASCPDPAILRRRLEARDDELLKKLDGLFAGRRSSGSIQNNLASGLRR